jgi:hypothetical protein
MGSRRLPMGVLLLILPLLGIAQPAQSPVQPRFPQAQISMDQWQSYLDEVKAIPGVACAEAASHQYKCNSAAQQTMWVFTVKGHPAHPAVTRGVMVVRQATQADQATTVGIDRSGYFAGKEAAFRSWMREFDALDQHQIAAWQEELKK